MAANEPIERKFGIEIAIYEFHQGMQNVSIYHQFKVHPMNKVIFRTNDLKDEALKYFREITGYHE